MERSYHSTSMSSKSPFSPRSRQSLLSSKRQFIPPSFRKSSRFSASGKSNQSVQVILKSENHFVERFGQPLPVLVTEALTFADKKAGVSARTSECGYAWIVCGRRLLVWQYRQIQTFTPQKKTINNQCFELPLPQSDLAHRAELVSVFVSSSSHVPSCIAVSPEGVVRYWPLVTHEGMSIEQVVDFQGQECDSLTDVGVIGCILATTTCSIVLVKPYLSGGRHQLSCHALKAPTGWLGGISKRMSSFIFGPITPDHTQETHLVRVLSLEENNNVWIVYVVAGHSLQKWRMSPNEPEQLIFVMELNRLVCDSFYSTVWENRGRGDQPETDTWLLDIQVDKHEVTLLTAAVNLHISPNVSYALVTIDTNTIQPPTNISDFFVLNLTSLYREDKPAESLSYKFLLVKPCYYLYNRRTITVIRQQQEPDALEFTNSQDLILGGSVCVNSPIFFSRNHGLVTVTNNELGQDLNISSLSINLPQEISLNESVTGNLSIYNIDAEEIFQAFRDTLSQLKAAFIFHIKNQQSACQEIIQQLFASEGPRIPGVDASLDKVVLDICRELLDDFPASDPRWINESSTTSVGLGSSYSMQVLHQLNDKQHAYNLFIRFLHDTDLWNQLAAVTERNTVTATVHVLGELSEKLIASISLKNLGSNRVLENAINKVISDDDIYTNQGLSKQDLFFREVTKVYRVFQEVVNGCEEIVHTDTNSNEIATHIKNSNDLILSILKDVIHHRQRSADSYKPNSNFSNLLLNYLPWTTASGTEGIGDSILLQETLTCNYGARMTGEVVLQNTLYDQMVNLIDIILDGNKSHLESIKGTKQEEMLIKQYQSDRYKLIAPLISDKKFEKAALLAEKYLDFEALVELCESTNNQQRLEDYMDKFNSVGFSEFVYTWYLQKNQPGKLIDRCRSNTKSKSTQHLTNFLADHPSLSWLQNIFDKKFSNAANILRDLAENEKELVTRQKTMFSLSKLAKLTSTDDDVEYVNYINSNLELIAFQEDVPDYVLQHHGYDTIKLKVISPKELVYLYTCEEYIEASEMEFKKALDILEFINDNELKDVLFLHIWRSAVLRDTWYSDNMDSPLDILQSTLFFKLADLAICLGADPENVLPPLDALIESPKLAELQESKHFQYLIKTCYEHVQSL